LLNFQYGGVGGIFIAVKNMLYNRRLLMTMMMMGNWSWSDVHNDD